ncbi:MAG: alpha/beta hydrolase-fold protein [Steroidobacteraceae bacterium]
MHESLRTLLASTADADTAWSGFAQQQAFRWSDPQGVTFVWHGDADQVLLRCWVSGLPAAQPFTRHPVRCLWFLHLDLPPGSRLEYKFEVIRQGHGEWVVDPLNPVLAADPFGANSVCQGWGYERPEWTQPDPLARPGSLDELRIGSDAFGEQRTLRVYLPARFRRTRRYPLLLVHDGDDYLRYAAFGTVLDNLIHRLEVAPLIVAFTQSPDRLREYAADERHSQFVVDEVLPALRARLPLEDTADARCLMGASFGAVATLHTAWRRPGSFGRLLLQSGSFAFSDIGEHRRGPLFDPVARFVNTLRADAGRPAERIYMSCGVYESLIYENRSLLPLLRDRGCEVRYDEARDAHNWENWRDRLQSGLSWLFPGPLWMVYE